MKYIFSTIICLILLLTSACEAYLDSQYIKNYLPEDLVFQYDSGDVFIYENDKGVLDSLMVYAERQFYMNQKIGKKMKFRFMSW